MNPKATMPSSSPKQTSRRDFLNSSSTAALGGALASAVSFPAILHAQNAGDKLKLGWVGCGGRGTGAINQALQADSNVELWSMGEVFRDKIDSSLETIQKQFDQESGKINVAEERKFVGLDAYQKVIDSGVDVVILTTSPGFRPQHIKAAVDAGKHVFCEKPMAVDGPGLRSVMESVKKAKEKKLAMVDGFVWRWTYANRDAYAKLHEGAIGDIQAIYASYYTGSVDRYPKWNRQNTQTDLEWMLRRWYYFTWLSGDHVVEQAVHSVDKIMWAMQDQPPTSCICTGGRQVKTGEEYGHIYDHFCAEYRWEGGVRGYLFTRQIDKCYNENADTVSGTKGIYQGESGSKRHVILGENRWRWQGQSNNGYQTEHDEMYASIRAGNPINTGDRFCSTTLAAIMARMAAYTGKEITWDMALNSEEDTFPKDLKWDSKIPMPPVAMPGITQFA
jgi:myo-inositol 2-dehydrogenase / D-chiro-inositol 1-dehydrogenase